MSEAIEPAKNRTSCDLCKRMKIRCEKQGDRCAHCISRDAECVVTIVPRKKRQKKTDYLSTLEDRLVKMEAVITAASSSLPGSASASQTPEDTADLDDEGAALSEKLSSLYIGPSGGVKYVGSSSGWTLFSPQGLEWINKKTGSTVLSDMVMQLAKSFHDHGEFSGPRVWHAMPVHDREPLPAPKLTRIYINSFFKTLNRTCPIFDQDVFEQEYARRPNPSHEDTAWYAALNMVVALGCVINSTINQSLALKTAETQGSISTDKVCWKYFRNASSLYVELSFQEPSLMAVQALLAMSIMIQAGSDTQPAYICTAAAVRVAYSIGLHRKMAFSGFTEAEIDQRSNTFWALYNFEQSQSLRSGRPSMIQDDDIGIDLPGVKFEREDTFGSSTFPKVVELSHLSSRVYRELYSSKSLLQSRLDRLKLVGKFDKELEQWRDSLPIEIRPGEPILVPEQDLVPVIMLHFHYYFMIATIHRVSVHHGYWMNEKAQGDNKWAQDAQLNPRVFASGTLCLSAARNTIRLFQHHYRLMRPFSDYNNLLRMADYFPLTAMLTLFANCIQNPRDEKAPADIELMASVIEILAGSNGYHPAQDYHAFKVFEEVMRIARLFVQTARSQDRNKRPHERLEFKDDNPQINRRGLEKSSSTSINEFTSANSGTGSTTVSPDNPPIKTPPQQESPSNFPRNQPYGYALPNTTNVSAFDPHAPLGPSLLQNSHTNVNNSFNPSNFDQSPVPGHSGTQEESNGWWPPTTINTSSIRQTSMSSDTGLPQTLGNYDSFAPSLEEEDMMLGWDPDAFLPPLPMNMTFQWELPDLWTGKGKGSIAE